MAPPAGSAAAIAAALPAAAREGGGTMPTLCVFSKAAPGECEGGILTCLPACPLGLSKEQGRECRCRRREHVGRRVADDGFIGDDWRPLVVLTCLYPLDWRGRRVGGAQGEPSQG